MNPSSCSYDPSSSSPTPIDASQMPIGAGDFFEFSLGGRPGPGARPNWLRDIESSLRASLSDDAVATFSPGQSTPGAQGPELLIVSGTVSGNWPDAAKLCSAVLSQASANNFAPNGQGLSCTITPSSAIAPAYTIPGWVILLALGFAFWLAWRYAKD
jgi:hypothetical protein